MTTNNEITYIAKNKNTGLYFARGKGFEVSPAKASCLDSRQVAVICATFSNVVVELAPGADLAAVTSLLTDLRCCRLVIVPTQG